MKLTKIIDPGKNEREFKYDIMGNVNELIYTDQSKILKEYDLAGRLTKLANKRNQTNQFIYDADGNLITETDKTTGERKKYSCDSGNHLIRFEHYTDTASPPDTVARYTYDHYGRRLKNEINGTVTHFFWEGNNLTYKLDDNFQPVRRYVFGAGKDRVEGHVEFSEVSGNLFDVSKKGWYLYVKDQIGTVYKVYSDSNLQMSETRTYDTFGNLIRQTGSSGGNLGFQGKYFDQESGFYYFFHWYYHPSNGRFLNEDPIGLDGGINMYAFVANNPIKWTDPYGLDFAGDHPKWMDLFCRMWKKLRRGSGEELGAWLYNENQRIEPESLWWRSSTSPEGRNRCSPRFIVPQSVNCGSVHTHPSSTSHRATEPEDTDFAKRYHPEWKMYIISRWGIWSYNPVTDEHQEVMNFRSFARWCRRNNCRGW